MSSELILEEVDIVEFPKLDVSHLGDEGAQITMGDLHGNTIKLLFLLIKHGIVGGLEEHEYNKITSIYSTATDELTRENLNQFNLILAKIKFNRGATIRLIGDELADRGYNDYFTLKLIEKLHEHGVNLEILLSNHGIEFIEAYETKTDFHPLRLSKEQHARSMEKMQNLIDKGLINIDEVNEIAKKCYKPKLKAISYTLNEDQTEITLYSHAAIGLNTIYCIAQRLGLPYEDSTAIALAQTIDAINERFQDFVQNNRVHQLYTESDMWKGYGGCADLSLSPFEFLMWNRHYDHIERPVIHNGYRVNFVHGHDMGDSTKDNIYNLDNFLGKGASANQGQYAVLYSHETPLKPRVGQGEIFLLNEDLNHVFAGNPPIEKAAGVSPSLDGSKIMLFQNAPVITGSFAEGAQIISIF